MLEVFEKLQTENINPIEEALGFKKLIEEFDYTIERLSKQLGKSKLYIENSLCLLKLNHFVQIDLLRNTITAEHAVALLPLREPATQLHFANLIWDWNWTVRETEINVARYIKKEDYLVWERNIPVEAVSIIPEYSELSTPHTKDELDAMEQSIKENGLLDPIRVTVDGKLFDGYARISICKKLDWKLIPANIVFWRGWMDAPATPIPASKLGKSLSPILDKMMELNLIDEKFPYIWKVCKT